MKDFIKVTSFVIKEGKEKGNVKPPSNNPKPTIAPAAQKPATGAKK